jgi:hypothetical protein
LERFQYHVSSRTGASNPSFAKLFCKIEIANTKIFTSVDKHFCSAPLENRKFRHYALLSFTKKVTGDMKKECIWCRKTEPTVSFKRKAHIFPQSLGGIRTCENVCDACNLYFGSKQLGVTSVEIALKEPLNISRLFLLSQTKKKNLPRFKSEYFDYDLKNQLIKPKFKYRLISDFQSMFTKQFKRGIYKIFLEERSESIGDALDPQFDFIREYARFGIGDYPMFYCRPRIPAVFLSATDLSDPMIRFTPHSEEVMKQYGFYSYYFITHTIAIPVIRNYELTISNYIRFILEDEDGIYNKMISLKYITDIDFIFSFAFGEQ